MNVTDACQPPHDSSRPVGFLGPKSERAVRALRALDEKRLRDAERHLAAIPESSTIDRAWKLLVNALLRLSHPKPDRFLTGAARKAEAESWLRESVALALTDALPDRQIQTDCVDEQDVLAGLCEQVAVERDAVRLAAVGFEKIGWFYRRQDRPEEAFRAHLAAYRLRDAHGSLSELWESATSLGLDADLARDAAVAQSWHRRAVDFAARAAEDSDHKLAVAQAHLARSLTTGEQHEEAVAAAGSARQAFRKHDLSAVTAAQADMNLGYALLRHGEALHDNDPARAKTVLSQAVDSLTTAHESLLAFGRDHVADAHWCLEQKDFAERLRASVEP